MLESVLLVQTPNGQGANYKHQKNRCHPPRSEQEPYQFLQGRTTEGCYSVYWSCLAWRGSQALQMHS